MLSLILVLLMSASPALQEPAGQPPVIFSSGHAVVKRAPDVAVVKRMAELGIPKDALPIQRSMVMFGEAITVVEAGLVELEADVTLTVSIT